MREILSAKFSIPEMAQCLIETKGYYLVEGTTWHDNIWGICILDSCPKCQGTIGLNYLGVTLMEIRESLLAGHPVPETNIFDE